MLFINVGIMLGVYVGVRVFEHYKNSSTTLFKQQNSHQMEEMGKNNLQAIEVESQKNQFVMEPDHYFKVSGAAMGLAAASYVYPPLTLLSVGITSYTAVPILKKAQNSLLKERHIKNDLLPSIVTVMCLAMGKYFSCALNTCVYHWGSKMLVKSKDISAQTLTNVFEQQPHSVWILKNAIEIEIPLEALHVNDIVVIKTGEVVPIDGIIIEGMATIDQHALTGEAIPAEKGTGDHVFAATILVSGQIQVKVEKAGSETSIAKLAEILNHTAEFKTSLQLKGEKWADNIATPMLGIGILASPIIGLSSATAILYGAPVNTIRVLTSLQTFNHMTLIANQGILVKDGRALEALPTVDTIFFDKTGTLTKEELEVGKIILCDDELGEDEILTYAASAERRFTHPIARAIIQKAEEQCFHLPEIQEANYEIGYGITVSLDDKTIKVGSIRFMNMEGIAVPSKIEAAIARSHEEGHSLIMVAINEQLKGAIEIQPQVRPEIKQIISRLRQRGVKHIAIVSGDHKQPTKKLADALGMDSYYYEILPQDKASLVEQFQKKGHQVCFVGDGINDAIAMKKANVSISLRGASSIATDMAQVVLMDGSLSHLCDVFERSTKLNIGLQQSLWFWAGYAVFNTGSASLLHFGVTELMTIYSFVFGLSVRNAMLPLKQLEHEKSKKVDYSNG
ncbi:heavy metal translocating P-type ATPase [Candidatus Marithioploca araucensis]|uniref:P-type Zn(2+) transporter n=1 Tax=Candidatus Marithioploca araucensis TaxID=70273 RepID=A0ABT7VS96_9GAMM|nr:heavy metal translocating P-type ATPase [Candidatus Marithioploca araucensis]